MGEDSGKLTTSDNSEAKEFLLYRAQQMVKEYDRSWNWVFIVTLIVSLFSSLLNIGSISANEISLGFAKLTIHDDRPIKIFICLTSISGAFILAYLHGFTWRASFISQFLVEKGFAKTALIPEYAIWEMQHKPYFNFLHSFLALMMFILIAGIFVIVPLWTLIFYGLAG